jgi:hypothetical protein
MTAAAMQPLPQISSEEVDQGIGAWRDHGRTDGLPLADCSDQSAGTGHRSGLVVGQSSRSTGQTGLLQVEEKSSGVGSLKALQPLLGDDTTVSAEIEILGSRMVLGRVVAKLKLDIVVRAEDATPAWQRGCQALRG